ncbi:MAG: YqaE/Pmp3 family membrane protein [Flavobacteriales bacterium]
MKKITLLSFIAVFLMAACTVEKRIYRNGYNIQWHTSLKVKNQIDPSSELAQATENKSASQIASKNLSGATKEQALPTLAVENVAQNNEQTTLMPLQTSKEVKEMQGVVKNYFVKETGSKASVQGAKVMKQQAKKLTHHLQKATDNSTDDVPYLLLFILCFIFPPIVVGLVTDWDTEIIIYNLLWCVLCGFPGIIHALIILGRYR